MLRKKCGHIILGDLANRPLAQQRRARRPQPFAFTNKLIVPGKLGLHGTKPLIYLRDHTTSSANSTATRTTSHRSLHSNDKQEPRHTLHAYHALVKKSAHTCM